MLNRMNFRVNSIEIAKSAKRVALLDAIEALEVEMVRLKSVNAEMAKGLSLAILYLRSQRNSIR